MSQTTAKLLFDECLGRPIIGPLRALIGMGKGEKPELGHVLEFTAMGTRDEDWIPRIANEGWTVITADGGKTPNKQRGEKLPKLCAQYGVTHVILSSAIQTRTSFEKTLSVLSVWYELIKIAEDSDNRGKKYMLEPLAPGERGKGRLSHRD